MKFFDPQPPYMCSLVFVTQGPGKEEEKLNLTQCIFFRNRVKLRLEPGFRNFCLLNFSRVLLILND